MKGLKLLFAVLLVPLAFQAAFANDEIDTSRAATTRRGAQNTVSANRQKNNPSDTKSTVQSSLPTSRTVNIGTSEKTTQSRERGTTQQVSNRTGGNVVNRTGTSAPQNKSVSARTASNIQQRITPSSKSRIMTRTTAPQQASKSRSGIISRAVSSNRTGTTTSSRSRSASTARSAVAPIATIETIQSRNFSACRNIFFECMDEFCANKDSTLKRCACSARIHEFDKTKEQLAAVEDKLLDFSQRLLTVSMDKEDAMVLNTATEGEVAYAVDDTSKSKKMLDEIAKKLNANFNNSNFDQNLNAISLSLNTEAAFDNIDSMMGASTTTKSGTELYSAALPVCREMAAEVCSDTDLDIAESSYQMSITQDCNTVAKSYETQNDQARAKIKESSALLDMSRLNVYQERNSDDILTCKTKMLEMLTDTTVCGTDMSKCLDNTGRYIDPTTGEAFLTETLADLSKLLTRPAPDGTWTKTPGNESFVQFLQSKKKYLEPAMENCQDISTFVWDAFIEDALAQIKLAQEAKLEQVRQSCTTLTTQCLDSATQKITDFDARALSIFGVKADVTINAMCTDIKNTCFALTNALGGATGNTGTTNEWADGITEIAANKTYESILSTCREIGKNCIIQACTDISGNFGLCTNINTSINRKSIVSRRACWAEVEQCVRDAGAETIAQIMKQQGRVPADGSSATEYYSTNGHLYGTFYADTIAELTAQAQAALTDNDMPKCDPTSTKYRSIYNWSQDIKPNDTMLDWQVYRLTEQIWGNCEMRPGSKLDDTNCTNRILINSGEDETLLSWFARNTNTTDAPDSCRDTICGYGFREYNGVCMPETEFTEDGLYCPSGTDGYNRITIFDTTTNCCSSVYNSNSQLLNNEITSCCIYGVTETYTSDENYFGELDSSASDAQNICNPTTDNNSNTATLAFSTSEADYYCVGGEYKVDNESMVCEGGVWTTVNKTTKTYTTPTTGNSISYYNTETDTKTLPENNTKPSGQMVGKSVSTTEQNEEE